MRVFLGTIWSSIKQVTTTYVFDWEQGIALHTIQGNRHHLTSRDKSHGFSRVAAGTWGILSSYGGDDPSKLVFVQLSQESCLVMRDTSRISRRLGRALWMLLEMRQETQVPFLVATVVLRFLLIFRKSQASSPFEALNSTCLSRCQRDVRPFIQMRQGLGLSLGSPQGIQPTLHLVR